MARVDVSVTRSLTINTGNYESIRPTVTLTARDISPENVGDAYLALEVAITGMLKMEVLNCHSEGRRVSDGLDRYCRDVNNNLQEIGENIEKSLNELCKF